MNNSIKRLFLILNYFFIVLLFILITILPLSAKENEFQKLYGYESSFICVSIYEQNGTLLTEGASSPDSITLGNSIQYLSDVIIGLAVSYGLNSQINDLNQTLDKKIHKPLSIIKFFDSTSPVLYDRLVSEKPLKNVTIKFYRISQTGFLEHYYTVSLENAVIVCINSYSEKYNRREIEEVSFIYKTITWTHEIAGTSSSDSWGSSDYND